MNKTPFEPKWSVLPEALRNEIVKVATEQGAKEAVRQFMSQTTFASEETFYVRLLQELAKRKKLVAVAADDAGLQPAEMQLLEDFKNGKVGYDRIQKELASRVFEKILRNPESVNVRDWLQSELVKLKQDETTKQKDALEKFVNSLFGGFIPSIYCPNCHKSTIIPTEKLGEVLDGAELKEDN